jgi:hypothetical protein
MQTLALPIQMRVTTTVGAKTAHFKCASVSSEGGFAEDLGYTFSTPQTAAPTVSAASGSPDTHLLSLQPITTFNSLTNRTRFRLNSVDIFVSGANPVRWKLCIGSTFTAAPTFAAGGRQTGSAFECSTAVGTLNAVGTVITGGFVAASAQSKSVTSSLLSNRYPISLDRAGLVRPNGVLSLLVSGVGGASATHAVFNWTEVR